MEATVPRRETPAARVFPTVAERPNVPVVGGATDVDTTGGDDLLQIPPTTPPKRPRPRWIAPSVIVVAVVLVGVTVSALLNREVTRRLATVPIATTSSSQATPTTVVPRPSRQRPSTGEGVLPAPAEATTTTLPAAPPEVAQETHDIIARLDALPVSEERTFGYARYRFGLWRDDDGDGCTVRDDVIIGQALESASRSNPCRIVSGRWQSPYDNAILVDPDDVSVDHVVSLAEAWRSGAWNWANAQRTAYLNDIGRVGSLLAVSTTSRNAKDARDPSDWLPPNSAFVCEYLRTYVDMKTVWKMSVDAGERESIAAAALGC